MTGSLLKLADVQVDLASRERRPLSILRGIDLEIREGEIVGLVGESGCGKSTVLKAIMRLLPDHAAIRGEILLNGVDLGQATPQTMRKVRGGTIGMIFQNPMSSLNPLMSIGAQIAEAIRLHNGRLGRKEAWQRAVDLLDVVAIADPVRRASQLPHELSGGMRQRVVIAMAIANHPALLIADEPTTALDVTIQAEIMELLTELCGTRNMGMVLVTHDLGLVADVAHRIAVMYAGRIVNQGPASAVLRRPLHPYTRALLRSLPEFAPPDGSLYSIPGLPPPLSEAQLGCAYAPRCEFATERCRVDRPVFRALQDQMIACHHAESLVALRPHGCGDVGV